MLTEALKAVAEFHVAGGAPVRWAGNEDGPYEQEVRLRLDLINEEVKELTDAVEAAYTGTYEGENPLYDVADALGDIIYVALGTFLSFGIDGSAVFEEIQRSNMTKFPTTLREDGKVLKGPSYEAPDWERVFRDQVINSIVTNQKTNPYLPAPTAGIPDELTGEEVQLYIDELRADGAEIEDVACILENFGFTVEVAPYHAPGCEGDCGVDAAAVDLEKALAALFERYPELEPDPAT